MRRYFQQIDDKYKELTPFKSVEESIYSEDEEAVLVALEVLAKRIKHDGIVEHLSTINILITRILCKNKNGYKSILDYLEYYVRFFAKDKETLAKIPQLIFLIDNLTMDVFNGENGAFPPTRDGCIHSLSMRERG